MAGYLALAFGVVFLVLAAAVTHAGSAKQVIYAVFGISIAAGATLALLRVPADRRVSLTED
jgi:hypothetical protein